MSFSVYLSRRAALVLACLLASCDNKLISDHDMTMTAIGETSVRIGIYVNSNGKLPSNFNVLAMRPNYSNRTTDAWNRPLIYQIEGDTFSLTSLGADGVAGCWR
jgi:hypothetical protein